MRYQDLVADHDRIDLAAEALLTAVRMPGADPAELSYRLFSLAALVSEHLSIEAAVLDDVRSRALGAHWQATLESGLPALEVFREDWECFLREWNAEGIALDFEQFQAEAELILPRLRERVQRETQALYATALQTGVLALG